MFKIEGDKTTPEPFAEEAKYFTEVRLLQRDVKIVLEGASNQNLLGTVIHPVDTILILKSWVTGEDDGLSPAHLVLVHFEALLPEHKISAVTVSVSD